MVSETEEKYYVWIYNQRVKFRRLNGAWYKTPEIADSRISSGVHLKFIFIQGFENTLSDHIQCTKTDVLILLNSAKHMKNSKCFFFHCRLNINKKKWFKVKMC